MTLARRCTDFCLVLAFVAGVGGMAGRSARRLYKEWDKFPPVARAKKLPAEFEAFFAPRLAGRGGFLTANAALKTEVFGVSPTPRVAVGRGGWLFYETVLEAEAMKKDHVAADDLIGFWAGSAILWHDWLAAQGIKLVTVVAPDKQSVYPEYQPAGRGCRRAPKQIDRILAALAAYPQVRVLDLRDELRAAKAADESADEVYFHNDTHWTPRAALAGYRATARALGQVPHEPGEYAWKAMTTDQADLPDMMAKTWGVRERFKFPYAKFPLPAGRTGEAVAIDESHWLRHMKPEAWQQNDPAKPKVVLIKDSFATDLYCQQLAQHCRRLVCVPSNTPDAGVIARERPDVVVWQMVERVLRTGMPGLPPPVSPAAPGETHARAK